MQYLPLRSLKHTGVAVSLNRTARGKGCQPDAHQLPIHEYVSAKKVIAVEMRFYQSVRKHDVKNLAAAAFDSHCDETVDVPAEKLRNCRNDLVVGFRVN